MFDLFKSPRFRDPLLGELVHSRGLWRGQVTLAGQSVPLALPGSRSEPDAAALAAAHALPAQYPAWRSAIAAALLEHREPYAEALAEESALTPDEVWPHVTLAFASITPMRGVLTVELGYTTDWDDDHTLGARFRDGALVELCGSVLPD